MDARDALNRDLLFGLVAVQNGLIGVDELIAAFRTWTRDKTRPIADVLAANGAIDADDRSLIDGLVAKHLQRNEGDAGRSLASMEAVPVTRYLLAEIGDADIDGTVSQVGSGSGSGPTPGPFPGDLPEGRRFRVLRAHAQGGLGAVFVALDEELHREVALKQILDHHADDPTSRTRFVLEAEITGGLEHPGIVPVYGLGSYGDGRPYYAMRFIRGDSLKEAIAAFHADPAHKADPGLRSLGLRKLLRRFVDVCNAIDYAHNRGVLHRDIKPANVILGKHGETLVVDWGLAKLVGKPEVGAPLGERTLMPASASGSMETLPGSAMGTPAFMSPEQAAGDIENLGPRSDVYSLGATLYAILTGRTAFEGLGILAVMEAVEKGDFPHPRSVALSVDRPLEAVCLKAMALKPDDRYETAKALAEEVERWSADEPVTAWREPLLTRAGRWGRRHRSAVGAIGLSLATAVVLLTISNFRVSQAQQETARALDRADLNFRRARQAVEESFKTVSEELLLEEPGMQPLREKLLESALKYHEAFLKDRADDPSVEAELAESHWRFGMIAQDVGRRKEALEHFQQAEDRFEGLARRWPNRRDYRRMVANVDSHIGSTLEREEGGIERGTAAYLKAIARFEDLVREDPKDLASLEGLATTLGFLGHLKSERLDGSGEAAEILSRARDLRRKLVAESASKLSHRRALVDLHILMYTRLVGDADRRAEALESSREARAMMDEMLRFAPNSPHLRFRSISLNSLEAALHARAGDYEAAIRLVRPSVDTQARLAATNPDVPIYRNHLARMKLSLGNYLQGARRAEESLGPLREACELFEQLKADGAGNFSDEKEYLPALTALAASLGMLGHLEESVSAFKKAAKVSADVAARDPSDIFLAGETLNLRNNLGFTLNRLERHREAVESYDQARELSRTIFGDPDWAHDPKDLLLRNLIRAYSLREVGRLAEATELVEKSRAEALEDAPALFDLARYEARGATLRAKQFGRDDQAQALERLALDHLRITTDRGQRGLLSGTDPAFEALHALPGFPLLLLDRAFPDDPFRP